jgi:NADH:ubiquinone oxidoreductase subunit 5 (subunit L)/multisubunit Na+/H+ antiporter MnhA subunit
MGYNWIVLSGNFETLFIGWEIIGAASFLLIAFYRMRYLPSKNAVKVFSIYRIGDIGILAAMWASHHLWHENITFLKLQNQQLVHHHLTEHSETGIFIGIMILLSAAVKSAQFPFSSWLPRAMEGPTPSSAIFYGSLSVHFGAFLLIRTYPFWEGQIIVKACVIAVGIITVLVHSMIARAQSTIKAQIAYSSSAQIGFIFIEIALGFHYLALIHFAGNALLRSYQLLISPSAVSFLLRQKTFNALDTKARKINSSLYILSLKEWNLDYLLSQIFFARIKKTGKLLGGINTKWVALVFIPLYVSGLILYFNQNALPKQLIHYLPEVYVIISFIMVVRAFAERIHPRMAWLLVLIGFLNMALGISFNEHFEFYQTELYSAGVFIAGMCGFIALQMLKKRVKSNYDLNSYHGYAAKYPGISLLFLLSALGISGFPITTAFIGEDLLFSHIHDHQFVLLIFTAMTFVFGGIAVIRIYARLFLGNNSVKSENSFLKSS